MKIVSPDQLVRTLASDAEPRVVISGNSAVPRAGMDAIDRAFARYTLHVLNAPAGSIPTRDGVGAETAFVGPGMRRHPDLHYIPCRLSMVPVLMRRVIPPDVVVLHCAPPRDGQLSLGVEVNILPAAIEGCRSRSGRVIAVINDRMPYTYGDAQVPVSDVHMAIEVSEPLGTHEAQ